MFSVSPTSETYPFQSYPFELPDGQVIFQPVSTSFSPQPSSTIAFPSIQQPSIFQSPIPQTSIFQPYIPQPSIPQPSILQPYMPQPSIPQPSIPQPSIPQSSMPIGFVPQTLPQLSQSTNVQYISEPIRTQGQTFQLSPGVSQIVQEQPIRYTTSVPTSVIPETVISSRSFRTSRSPIQVSSVPISPVIPSATFLPRRRTPSINRVEDKDFEDVLMFVAETETSKVENPLDLMLVSDHTFEFFRNILNESDQAIRDEVDNAINFFEDHFGIDVKSFDRKNDHWVLGNHRFVPRYVSQTVGYRPYFTKNRGTTSGQVLQGGFDLIIGSPGITTKNGKFIPAGRILSYGYYKIIFDDDLSLTSSQANDRLIHYRTPVPLHSDLETVFPINYDVYDFDLKMWGRAVGGSSTYDMGDSYHISIRASLTFPGGH